MWVIENALGGESWTEIDRETGMHMDNLKVASFAVSNVAECRFIRLTQTEKNSSGDYDSDREE
jgi:hypothetical protein